MQMNFRKYHKEFNLLVGFQMIIITIWNLLNNYQKLAQANLLVLFLILVKKWLYSERSKLNRKGLLEKDKQL